MIEHSLGASEGVLGEYRGDNGSSSATADIARMTTQHEDLLKVCDMLRSDLEQAHDNLELDAEIYADNRAKMSELLARIEAEKAASETYR